MRFASKLCHKHLIFWQLASNTRIIRNFFSFSKAARQCKRLVEKTPGHIHYVDRLILTYPKAKVLIIARHPVHIFSSIVKRSRLQSDHKWLKIDVQTFISNYKSVCAISKSTMEKYKNQTKLILYENFVNDPQETFKAICDFLDEEFEPEALLGGENSLKDWKADPYLSRPISAMTKNWGDYIDVEDCRIIENSLENEMLEYGYEMGS
jgi:hypothetical protein